MFICRQCHQSTLLSTFVQSYFSIQHQFDVSRHCFTPPPSVTSSVFTLHPLHHDQEEESKRSSNLLFLKDPTRYYHFLQGCFQSKNQSLQKNLLRWSGQRKPTSIDNHESIQPLLLELEREGHGNVRPWELSSEVYIRLFDCYSIVSLVC